MTALSGTGLVPSSMKVANAHPPRLPERFCRKSVEWVPPLCLIRCQQPLTASLRQQDRGRLGFAEEGSRLDLVLWAFTGDHGLCCHSGICWS
jgi:hypothetical protein